MKPMLAVAIKDDAVIQYPVIASPKLDGIRAVVRDGQLLSRRLLTIPNRATFNALSDHDYNGLDGELIVGLPNAPNAYTTTMSGIMSEDGAPDVTYWVFDRWDLKASYNYRRARLPARKRASPNVMIRRLAHEIINSRGELQAYEHRMLMEGFEGIILRQPDSFYRYGRSTPLTMELMKLKRFQDGEARILGIVEQIRNDNPAQLNELGYTKRSSHKANRIPKGTTGALQVQDLITGILFEIGSGMNDQLRQEFWAAPPLGKIVKYKYQATGVKDRPRFPVFLGLRDERDMS